MYINDSQWKEQLLDAMISIARSLDVIQEVLAANTPIDGGTFSTKTKGGNEDGRSDDL